MEFIKCGPEMRAELEELYGRVVEDLQSGTNYPQWSPEYPAGGVQDAVVEGSQYAVTEDGRILGAVVLSADPGADYSGGSWSQDLAPGEFLTVHALAVAPEARGRGLGAMIVESCLKEAARRGARAVRLDIVPENLPARKLYTRLGFRSAGLADLGRGMPQVPLWELFECNLPADEDIVP